jgi:hypothetical protein
MLCTLGDIVNYVNEGDGLFNLVRLFEQYNFWVMFMFLNYFIIDYYKLLYEFCLIQLKHLS